MNRTWKWILGILLVVVLVGALAAGWMWHRHMNVMSSYRSMPMERNWHGPMVGPNDSPRLPQTWDRRSEGDRPMMNQYYSHHSRGGFFLFGGLVKLALFFGLLYGAYWLGRRNARITLDPAPAVPVADPVPAPEAEPAIPTTDAEVESAPRKRGKKIA